MTKQDLVAFACMFYLPDAAAGLALKNMVVVAETPDIVIDTCENNASYRNEDTHPTGTKPLQSIRHGMLSGRSKIRMTLALEI